MWRTLITPNYKKLIDIIRVIDVLSRILKTILTLLTILTILTFKKTLNNFQKELNTIKRQEYI